MSWSLPAVDLHHPAVGVVRVGRSALSLRVEGPELAASLAGWLRRQGVACTEVVPAASSVLLDGVQEEDEVLALVRRWLPEALHRGDVEAVRVPVTYDGADLARVAEQWQVTVDEVVARHTGTEFLATFGGFAPGFSYLSGLPAEWALPRLSSPRARVPAGSVALADRWCGIYPSASPGGWLLLGRTDLAVWDLSRTERPSLLTPGTPVRFVVA